MTKATKKSNPECKSTLVYVTNHHRCHRSMLLSARALASTAALKQTTKVFRPKLWTSTLVAHCEIEGMQIANKPVLQFTIMIVNKTLRYAN